MTIHINQYKAEKILLIVLLGLVNLINITSVAFLFYKKARYGFFAIPSILCFLISVTMLLSAKSCFPSKQDQKSKILKTAKLNIVNHTILFGAIISNIALVILILQYKGIIAVENLNAFIIFIALPLWPLMVGCLPPSLDSKKITLFSTKASSTMHTMFLILVSAFSTAIITSTYITYGNTGMMALPIIVAILLQTCIARRKMLADPITNYAENSNSRGFPILASLISTPIIMALSASALILTLHLLDVFQDINVLNETTLSLNTLTLFIFLPYIVTTAILAIETGIYKCINYYFNNDHNCHLNSKKAKDDCLKTMVNEPTLFPTSEGKKHLSDDYKVSIE